MITSCAIEERREEKAFKLLAVEPEPRSQQDVLLVPFEMPKLSPRLLEAAVSVAEARAAKLVILCVRPDTESLLHRQEDEHIFSDLKGLQARLQSRSAAISVETVAGPMAQFLSDFADRSHADGILIPGHHTSQAPTA